MTLPLARLTGTHITASNDGTDAMRYCEDCKFCDATPGMKFARCHAPQNILSETADHLVSRALKNEVTWRVEYCSSQRGPQSIGTCGTDAKWFEPKDAEQAAA